MADTRPRWTHQTTAFTGTLDAIARGVKRLCVTSPTGSGKTTILTDLLEWAVANGKTASLFTQRKLLFDQLCVNLERDGIPYGRIASGHDKDLAKPIQVVMVQTAMSRKKQGHPDIPAQLVLVDEYHQFGGDRFQEVLKSHGDAPIVGFTATPLDLVNVDELIVAATVPDLIHQGILVPADTYAPDEPDLRHIKKYQVGTDISEADNHKAIIRPGVFGRVIKAWKAYNPMQKPTLLFGPDVAGSKFFAEEFNKAGIRAAHIDGEDVILDGVAQPSTSDAREQVLDLYRAGEVKVICNRFVLREGIDLRETECMILASAFGSISSYLQAGGRGLRCCPERGKTSCVVIDHGGNWLRLGSLNAKREWWIGQSNNRMVAERQDRMREKKEPEPICCPQCGKVRLHGRECPACKYMAVKKSRVVVQIDGTLRHVEGDAFKPRRVRQLPNQEQLWKQMYYRMKRTGRTFRQAEALYCVENHGWPPRDLPFMPKDPADWWRKVESVPVSDLIPK